MKSLNSIINYFNVGIAPNSFGALGAGVAVLDARAGYIPGLVLSLAITSYNLTMGMLKYREYKKVKRALGKRGWDDRLIEPMAHSWCQRHAARQATKDVGYLLEFDDFMKREGHKWYHFLPR